MVRFIDVYDKLPASAPVGHPHIVEDFDEETNKDNLRAADGIATFLYHFNPSVLDDFLNMSIPSVEVIRHEKSSSRYDLIIARTERAVMCGFMRNAEFVDMQLSFGIKEDGSWVPLSGFCEPFYPTGPGKGTTLDEFGTDFAAQIVYHKLWNESTAKEIETIIG
ncbi:MAG: hypothetical protein Q9223_007443 [Gallowayella weberi]